MVAVNLTQYPDVAEKTNPLTTLLLKVDVRLNRELEILLANLAPDTPWGERQIAARKLGYMRDPEALPGLLAALPTDPFWMVRCAIIRALELIGDPGAVPTLREVAKNDSFQVVRAYAKKAIERLS